MSNVTSPKSSGKKSPSLAVPATAADVLPMSTTLEASLRAMNEEFCFVERIPGIAVIPTADDPELHVYSRGEFVQSVCSDRIVGRTNVAASWMQWKPRKKVKRLTYAPGKPQIHNKMLNTWVPPSIKPIKGDLTLWNAYVDHIFALDSTHQSWFIAWLAYQFQHPGTKLHSAVVFWSTETGTGKSLFGYIMEVLFGPHNFSEINEGELHGNFNHWAARKQFVMGEEIKGANAQRHADTLKAIITRKNVTINTKNTPHYVLPDCINYFFTSNHDQAFYIDDTDRRFFVHELGAKKLDADYVNNTLMPWLKDGGGYAAILHYLQFEVDLSLPLADGKPFNPYAAAPHTRARANMIEAGREDIDVWIESITGEKQFLGLGRKLATAEDLYSAFTLAYPRSKLAYKSFASKVRKAFPMARGGNLVPLDPDMPAKRLFCPPSAFRSYEGASVESLKTSYEDTDAV